MTTYPVSPPSNGYTSVALTVEFANSMTESPFNFSGQVYDWGSARWRMDFTLPSREHDYMEDWVAFALSLRGQRGTFLVGDPSRINPRGVGGGSPLVNGGTQTGETLIIDGAPVSTTGWLKAGDYFQLGSGATSHLHKLVSDVNTDSSGNATLDFVPPLRGSPADNAAITTVNCKGQFRLSSNQTPWTVDASGKIIHLSFTALEAL